jgi:PAS domain S-box-containing protein
MRSSGHGRAQRIPAVSAAAALVFVLLSAASASAFAVARNVVADNDRHLLEQRASEVAALLRSSLGSANATLGVLALLAASQDRVGFEQGARALLDTPGRKVFALAEENGRFSVVAIAGSEPPAPAVTGDLGALAARALSDRRPASGLVIDGGRTSLAIAVAAPEPSGVVAVLETAIEPSRPIPSTPGTPFREVSAALYAAPLPDPSRLVLTNERHLPIRGRVVHAGLDMGSERWALEIGAPASLSGTFPAQAPWILMLAGIVTALLVSGIVQMMARRQLFAQHLVQQRTSELENTRRFLQRLLDSALTVVVRADVSDCDHRLSYVSPNAQRIFGVEPATLVGDGHLESLVHLDDVGAARAATNVHTDDGSPMAGHQFRIRHGDGSYRWVSSTTVPEVDEQGATTGVFVYMTDISDRRAAETELRVAQQAAETANRSKSEFLSRMSHELRTPLNAVLGFGQLLEMQSLAEEQRDAVHQILKGGRHLLDLINEVLDIARIEAGRLPLSPEAVLVSEIVQESINLVRPLASERSITVVADHAGMSAYVFADRQRVKQVLLNLLSNAVKYNQLEGRVVVCCRDVDGTDLRITVTDTGPGIRPDHLDRLFTPFDRLDAGRTDVEGTGIGLALSRSLAEAMGGSLSVESTVGQGSAFFIDLPAVEGPVERYERSLPKPCPAGALPAGELSDSRRHKLLCIEDNLSNIKLIERILAKRDDVEVLSAMQGGLGVDLARQHQPRMILLDLHLPDVPGERVLRQLREDPRTASIPVVMVTADATIGQVQRLVSAGATAYLTKPLDVALLLKVVDEVLASARLENRFVRFD